jgi:hypothetical protein
MRLAPLCLGLRGSLARHRLFFLLQFFIKDPMLDPMRINLRFAYLLLRREQRGTHTEAERKRPGIKKHPWRGSSSINTAIQLRVANSLMYSKTKNVTALVGTARKRQGAAPAQNPATPARR